MAICLMLHTIQCDIELLSRLATDMFCYNYHAVNVHLGSIKEDLMKRVKRQDVTDGGEVSHLFVSSFTV